MPIKDKYGFQLQLIRLQYREANANGIKRNFNYSREIQTFVKYKKLLTTVCVFHSSNQIIYVWMVVLGDSFKKIQLRARLLLYDFAPKNTYSNARFKSYVPVEESLSIDRAPDLLSLFVDETTNNDDDDDDDDVVVADEKDAKMDIIGLSTKNPKAAARSSGLILVNHFRTSS